MSKTPDNSRAKLVFERKTLVGILAVLVIAGLAVSSFWGALSQIGLRAMLLSVAVVALLWRWRTSFTTLGAQQAILFFFLIFGLSAHFFVAWSLFSSGAIASAQDVTQIQRAGTNLFLPFLGVAVGGVFGVKRLPGARAGVRADAHTFIVAISIVVFWDALAMGNLWAIETKAPVGRDGWALEDVVRFASDIMPLVSVLPAAAIGFYFGAQTGESPLTREPPISSEHRRNDLHDDGGQAE
jgi:hypothetical protein